MYTYRTPEGLLLSTLTVESQVLMYPCELSDMCSPGALSRPGCLSFEPQRILALVDQLLEEAPDERVLVYTQASYAQALDPVLAH
eukprot:4803273-Pleurochrysis_carterae.AAC.2